jgi:pyruvate dehydrogenase E2 component (dihydrolipoamide acetyltransferase)
MADIIKMPKLGFDMAEGTLIRWVKSEGDQVEKGELLAEIETDKATVEVESMFAGTVRQHLVTEGAIVPVSKPIAVVAEKEEDFDLDDLLGDLAEDEAPVTAPEPSAAAPAQSSQPVVAAPATTQSTPAASASNGSLPDGLRATPVARRMAKEKNIDLRAVTGSGPQGRIVKKDIETFVPGASTPASSLPAMPAIAMPDLGPAPADKRIELSRLRGAIGRRMSQARTDIPHFYVTHEYDMEPVMAARAQANAVLQASGEKLSVNDFVVKASALALRQYPNLNASLDGDKAVIHHGHVNIGVAVAVENGLLVIVVHDADRKPIRQISQDVRDMAARVRSGVVHQQDIEGSTFSVSNLGMFDVAHFVAIINPPEAAILALGSANQVPVVKDGHIVVGTRMQATISVDHRVSDGAEAAQYLQALGQYLENPAALLMQ